MSLSEIIFGLAHLAVFWVGWKSLSTRFAAGMLLFVFVAVEVAARIGYRPQMVTGQVLNVIAGVLLFAVWVRGKLRAPSRLWILALSLSFDLQNYLHLQEVVGLAQLPATDAWGRYFVQRDLWVNLCVINALQLLMVVMGPRANGILRLFDGLFPCPSGRHHRRGSRCTRKTTWASKPPPSFLTERSS